MKRRKSQTKYISIAVLFAIFTFPVLFPDLSEAILHNKPTDDVKYENFQKAYVADIVDGDTIWVEIDSKRYKVRFIGVNTSEKGEPLYLEAKDYTQKSLLNKWIYLEKDVSEVDKYNRLLRYIWLDLPLEDTDFEKSEKLFNSHLLLEGLAEIVEYRPDVKYSDYYKRLMHQ